MNINWYQEQAMSTCMDSCANDCYGLFGLTAEVGELTDLIAKGIRKEDIRIEDNIIKAGNLYKSGYAQELCEKAGKELGDILWFVAHLARQFGYSLEEIAQMNLDKLAERKANGTIVTHEDH